MSTKNGKKPVSEKPNGPIFSEDDIFGSALSIPEAVKEDIENNDLECRFVDSKILLDNHGYHKRGWTAYRKAQGNPVAKESGSTINSQEFLYGSDPHGVVRRGSMVLAVRPKAVGDKHRLYLKQKAERYSQAAHKSNADQLRQMARGYRVDTRVEEDDGGDE